MEFRPEASEALARAQDIVIQDSGSELLIYDLKTNTAMSLNETSARIWRSCNGKRQAADIRRHLEESDGVYVNQDLVLLALRQLSDADLLAAKIPESTKPEGVSRRKLLRQIGAGSAVALPIIHSIVAPQASAAATNACTIAMGEIPNTQGTCPDARQRCVGGFCEPCREVGEAIPNCGGDVSSIPINLAMCCTGLTCSSSGGLAVCAPGF